MSTPSTATASYPSHRPHYGYPHHQLSYQSGNAYPPASSAGHLANGYAYAAANDAPSAAQPLPAPTQEQPAQDSTVQQNRGSASSERRSRRRRQPNWAEFYKNGIPKEVIVIDDTPPPEEASSTASTANQASAAQPAGKRRRTGVETAYDVSSYDRPSFSINPQSYGEDSSAGSLSTDRTASLQTTAPTSLGSHGSATYEEANVGQKRKRVTRKSARDEQKRRELETETDAYLSYVPPPNPPIKAKEVHVPVIRDVSLPASAFSILMQTNPSQNSWSRNQKCDDEDGHYLVTANTNLTDRCRICPV